MYYAISLNSILPVRSESRESSEMVTQLLFGETCIVREVDNSFVRIENTSDAYTGWVDKKMLTEISEDDYNRLENSPMFRTNIAMADTFCLSERSMYHLSLGSRLPFFSHETNKFEIAGKTFQIHPSFVNYITTYSKENIVPVAMLFLNSPYLWGGKNVLGIDCSGFVQVVYSLNGYTLPRDASDQVRKGQEINSLEEAEVGDLLFFEKQEKITHVGIYLGDDKVIHASGKVRVDKVDMQGIYNEEISEYTHKLASIRSI